MDNQPQISQTSNLTPRPYRGFSWRQDILIVLIAGFLFFVGLILLLAPDWPASEDLIHITVVPGHGITTQDAIAFVPMIFGLVLLSWRVWTYRHTMRQSIEASPLKAFRLALIVGIGIGLLVGVGVGLVFEDEIVDLVRAIAAPFKQIFYG